MISNSDVQILAVFFGEKFRVSDKKTGSQTKFFFVKSPDGTIRWVFPETCKAETLLSLYNSAGWRGKVLGSLFRLAFATHQVRWLASGSFWTDFEENTLDFAIFTGTPGRNRKIVVSYSGQYFEKIPLTPEATKLTQRELDNLLVLEKLLFGKILIPMGRVTPKGGLLQNSVRPEKILPSMQLTPRHYAALEEVQAKTQREKTLQSTYFYQKIKENCALFEQCKENDFTQKANPLFANIKKMLLDLEQRDPTFHAGWAHGDFTPWNCFLPADEKEPLAVYDWELAIRDAPVGFDALHFTIQSGILLRRLAPEQLKKEAQKVAARPNHAPELLRLYLIYTVSYYLPLYARQEDLHKQVWWLLEAWEGLCHASQG